MAISVLLRGLARRSQISTCLSSYESVFRNVNTPMVPWAGFVVGKTLSLGRALCSKPDLAAQNETKILSVTNPTKIVFKYVRATDEPQEDSKCFKIRKIIETPTRDALFQLNKGGDKYYSMSNFFLSLVGNYMKAAESFSGRKVSALHVVIPPLFNLDLHYLLMKAEAFFGMHASDVIADMIADSIPSRINSVSEYLTIPYALDNFVSNRILEIMRSGDRVVVNSDTGLIKLTLDLDDFLALRIWEIITNGDKTVMEIILAELLRNGFDITEDPLALQKLEQSVERAIARGSNAVKLNLPVPAGPEVSTTISWGTSDGCFVPCSTSGDC